MTLTIKSCLTKAEELNVPIIGDVSFRGDCKKEDSELIQFFTDVRYHYPQYAHLIFHPENEMKVNGGSSYKQHSVSVAKGRLDGLADIIVLPINKNAPALIIELKRFDISKSLAGEKLKIHFLKQLMCLSSQKQNGAIVCVALGCQNAFKAFEDYVKQYG